MPPEYIFIDEPRLNLYLEHYDPDAHAVRKTKTMEWRGKLPLPEAALTQKNEPRPLTVGEKIAALESHLLNDECLRDYRPRDRWEKLQFVKETFQARLVIVPQSDPEAADTPAFRFWLCPETERIGALCLLENCRVDDGDSINFSTMSSYSLLQSLVYYTRSALRRTIIQNIIPNDPPPSPHSKYDESHPPSTLDESHNVRPFISEFMRSPFELLRKWNCKVLESRRVTALYRVREYGEESTNSAKTVSTFAYPIYIKAMA